MELLGESPGPSQAVLDRGPAPSLVRDSLLFLSEPAKLDGALGDLLDAAGAAKVTRAWTVVHAKECAVGTVVSPFMTWSRWLSC